MPGEPDEKLELVTDSGEGVGLRPLGMMASSSSPGTPLSQLSDSVQSKLLLPVHVLVFDTGTYFVGRRSSRASIHHIRDRRQPSGTDPRAIELPDEEPPL